MLCPIFLPRIGSLSIDILAAEADIIAEEGRLSVAGVQYDGESDAALARRQEAERRVLSYMLFVLRFNGPVPEVPNVVMDFMGAEHLSL